MNAKLQSLFQSFFLRFHFISFFRKMMLTSSQVNQSLNNLGIFHRKFKGHLNLSIKHSIYTRKTCEKVETTQDIRVSCTKGTYFSTHVVSPSILTSVQSVSLIIWNRVTFLFVPSNENEKPKSRKFHADRQMGSKWCVREDIWLRQKLTE